MGRYRWWREKKYELGKEKGYIDELLNKDCGTSDSLNIYVNLNKECSLPKEFSIFTLNIMGIIKKEWT